MDYVWPFLSDELSNPKGPKRTVNELGSATESLQLIDQVIFVCEYVTNAVIGLPR